MSGSASVVVTGASRGLGLVTAAHLYRRGWRVVAAVRSPDAGLKRLRDLTGAVSDDPRLTAVRLDLDEPALVVEAAAEIVAAVGAPDAIVHNAGVAAAGTVEELPAEAWERLFRTNLFGPVLLTKELLPPMRAAGRGRIVILSSQGGIRGMATVSAYAGAKAAVERWAEALAAEIAPFGLGVTLLVPGAFTTEILEQTVSYADPEGPYGALTTPLEKRGRRAIRLAAPPERFAPAVERALRERAPFARRAVGLDARVLLHANRLLPARVMHRLMATAMGLPRPGSLRGTVHPPSGRPSISG
ncbi:SDR family NAD(P)-dependent oxidoreductase [Actinomadura rugatobispora]|uniref:SDR family NAD(P)-dependent oxidoreductase n=1 Tax=Actinomadura rugatobispora TaxID=1994 RepID=A0ABW1A0B1_9ACTN|nr:SDR family oxidoreductase [Actinomadura rugatobispora]